MSYSRQESLDRIDGFSGLEEGWDTCGAHAIEKSVRDRTKALVLDLEKRTGLLPDFIAPGRSGEVDLEYRNEINIILDSDPSVPPQYIVWAGPEILERGEFASETMERLIEI